MDRETVERIFSAAERERGLYAINFPSLVNTAAEMVGSLNWRDVAELALRLPGGEAGQPMQLLEFVAELVHALRPSSALDPWVMAPTMLAAAHEASGSSRSCGSCSVRACGGQRSASCLWVGV